MRDAAMKSPRRASARTHSRAFRATRRARPASVSVRAGRRARTEAGARHAGNGFPDIRVGVGWVSEPGRGSGTVRSSATQPVAAARHRERSLSCVGKAFQRHDVHCLASREPVIPALRARATERRRDADREPSRSQSRRSRSAPDAARDSWCGRAAIVSVNLDSATAFGVKRRRADRARRPCERAGRAGKKTARGAIVWHAADGPKPDRVVPDAEGRAGAAAAAARARRGRAPDAANAQRAPPVTFADAAEAWLVHGERKRNLKRSTLKDYRQVLDAYLLPPRGGRTARRATPYGRAPFATYGAARSRSRGA